MAANHLELLVEEPSMEAFLNALLPRLLPPDRSFLIHSFQGKADLLEKLGARLRAYSRWLPADWRIIVLVDRDDEECKRLKKSLNSIAHAARLKTMPSARWQLVNRIAIEELEAWYFGDWLAVRRLFPRVSASIPAKAGFRDPDAVPGGTWESLERILQKHGYFPTGLRKTELARSMGAVIDVSNCSSRSFVNFRDAIAAAVR